jgi:hypothetical protein
MNVQAALVARAGDRSALTAFAERDAGGYWRREQRQRPFLRQSIGPRLRMGQEIPFQRD